MTANMKLQFSNYVQIFVSAGGIHTYMETYEDNLKYEDFLKFDDNPNRKTTSNIKTILNMKMTWIITTNSKMKTTSNMKTTSIRAQTKPNLLNQTYHTILLTRVCFSMCKEMKLG